MKTDKMGYQQQFHSGIQIGLWIETLLENWVDFFQEIRNRHNSNNTSRVVHSNQCFIPYQRYALKIPSGSSWTNIFRFFDFELIALVSFACFPKYQHQLFIFRAIPRIPMDISLTCLAVFTPKIDHSSVNQRTWKENYFFTVNFNFDLFEISSPKWIGIPVLFKIIINISSFFAGNWNQISEKEEKKQCRTWMKTKKSVVFTTQSHSKVTFNN